MTTHATVVLRSGGSLLEAAAAKDRGNLHFKKRAYANAISEYSKGIGMFEAMRDKASKGALDWDGGGTGTGAGTGSGSNWFRSLFAPSVALSPPPSSHRSRRSSAAASSAPSPARSQQPAPIAGMTLSETGSAHDGGFGSGGGGGPGGAGPTDAGGASNAGREKRHSLPASNSTSAPIPSISADGVHLDIKDGDTVRLSFAALIERDAAITAPSAPSAPHEDSRTHQHAKVSEAEETARASFESTTRTDVPMELELYTNLLSNRALIYTANRNYELAWNDATTVMRLRPNWVKGYFRRGEVYLRLNRYSDALKDYKTALLKEPKNQTILERIERVNIHLDDVKANLVVHQLSVARGDLCHSRSILTPVQNLIFDFALQMRNFVYLVGDPFSREVVVVDACWDIDGILKFCTQENLTIVAALVTHYHIDHVGGIPPTPYDKYGIRVDGLAKILKRLPKIRAYINPNDIYGLMQANPEIPQDRLYGTADGEVLTVGSARFTFLHTPGHTPGSQCVLVNGVRLLSGDTLFIRSCGRCDFADSDPAALGRSLEMLAALEDAVVVLPGHDYGGEFTTVAREKANGLLGAARRSAFVGKQMLARRAAEQAAEREVRQAQAPTGGATKFSL
ncbi:beta-lactamase-like protein [Chytriomyces sp. MP71]|nr:beta-lactamase-like protein [Chytriomyces sp. MP71]